MNLRTDNQPIRLPNYAKASIIIVGLATLLALLYVAQDIIKPIVFSIIIAILLNPVVLFFERMKTNRIVAISITMLITFLVISALALVIIMQVSHLSESWPDIATRFNAMIKNLTNSISDTLGINHRYLRNWVKQTRNEVSHVGNETIGRMLYTVGAGIATLVLVPVYVFILMLYRPLLLEFIHRLFSADIHNDVNKIISQTKRLIQSYLIGLVIEVILIATMYSVTLLILGVDYALLLGIVGALLNMIPYVGGVVGAALPMLVALATKESGWYAVYILVTYYIIQLIDNNFIVPKIVAGKVKINALFSIIAVLVGSAMWGVAGMFLSIPLLAVIKLLCDNITGLKPWGYLLSDTMPPILQVKMKLKRNNNDTPLETHFGS